MPSKFEFIQIAELTWVTAHARDALFLDAEAPAALDVGALHARAVRFDAQARVLDYHMTSQGASGTGQFLENIARYLGVTLEALGPISRRYHHRQHLEGHLRVDGTYTGAIGAALGGAYHQERLEARHAGGE